jgi:hypothetical protein
MVEPVLTRLARHDFRALTRHRLVAVHDGEAEIAPVYSGPRSVISAENVVFVSHNAPNRELHAQLTGKVVELRIVGDAASPRFISAAFREGHTAAIAI